MGVKTPRRPQTQKPRNEKFEEAMRDIAKSSRAARHRNHARYDRKLKHRGRGWE